MAHTNNKIDGAIGTGSVVEWDVATNTDKIYAHYHFNNNAWAYTTHQQGPQGRGRVDWVCVAVLLGQRYPPHKNTNTGRYAVGSIVLVQNNDTYRKGVKRRPAAKYYRINKILKQ
jgi:hypothetical protein